MSGFYVEKGTAALHVKGGWVGAASGNRFCAHVRKSADEAIADATELEGEHARAVENDPETNTHLLPDDHVLKPLEMRLLQMAEDAGPMGIWLGNAVAALRVFAAQHPGLVLTEAAPIMQATKGTDG